MNARTRIARTAAVVTATVLGVLAPAAARACAVCFSGSPRTRLAFFNTTMLLSLLPLGLIGGGILWLRKNARQAGVHDEAGDVDDVIPAPESTPRTHHRGAEPRSHGA